MIGGNTSVRYVPSTGMRASRSMPAIVTISPMIVSVRTPAWAAYFEASPAEIMIPAVNGRNASPASSGPYPSTRWMYSELKKNIAKSPDATSSITTFAVVSVRVWKMSSRTSGAVARRSITTNATSRANATATVPIVQTDVHPFCCVFTIA